MESYELAITDEHPDQRHFVVHANNAREALEAAIVPRLRSKAPGKGACYRLAASLESANRYIVTATYDMHVTSEEVKELLRRVGNGASAVELQDPNRFWNTCDSGELYFKVDGWTVVIFNDCDSWDYVDHVITPDGRRGDFDQWCTDRIIGQPDDSLCREDPECYNRMVRAFKFAT